MGAALVLLLVGLGAMAAGVLIGRYYVPDDRQLRRTARHSRAYMRALNSLVARDHETAVTELRSVVEENVEDSEPYFALGALFRSRGEHERAIRVHQALAVRDRDRRKLRMRAMYELGMDFRAVGMPRRATRAMEEVLLEEPNHEGALRALASLYEEQARFQEAAEMWQRLGKRRGEDTSSREHHLLVAAAQAALGRGDRDSARQLLKAAQKAGAGTAGARTGTTPHALAVAAELAGAKGQHKVARERLIEMLIAEPGLAAHVLPGMVAAEAGMMRDGDGAEDEGDGDGDMDANRDVVSEAGTAAGTGTGTGTAAGTGTATGTAAEAVSVSAPAPAPASASAPAPAPAPVALVAVPAAPAAAAQLPPELAAKVLAVLDEVAAKTGPRLELLLIRAQLAVGAGHASQDELARELVERFPEALAARVAAGRLALQRGEPRGIREALDQLAGERGTLAWALHGRWQCSVCGNRPGPFTWRCGQCRRWGTLRMETGVEPPPAPPRDRRAQPRSPRPEGLLGASPDGSLPTPTLDPGLSEDELARAGTRRSLLGRVGGWFQSALKR